MDIVHDTPELRAELDAHNQNAIRLHIPTAPVTWVDLMVEDADGKKVHQHREKANSWVRNYYNLIAGAFLPSARSATFGLGYLGLKTTNGSAGFNTTLDDYITGLSSYWVGDVSNSAYGIVVGTGVAAESFESYALSSLVATGNSAGQMAYQAGTLGTATYNAETKKWTQTMTRIFNNNTASTVTITEVGLYMQGVYNAVFMLDRSLLASAVPVPAANKLTVTYTTEMTFPA